MPRAKRRLAKAAPSRTPPRRHHASLKQRVGELEFVHDAAGVVSWVWDIAADRFEWFGDRDALLGLPPETFSGLYQDYLARVHPDDAAGAKATFLECLKGLRPKYRAEERVVHPDGSIHWLETFGKAQYGGDGRALRMAGVVRDITEAIEANRRLQESLRKFASVFETSPEAIAVTRARDDVHIETNGAWSRLIGHARGSAVGRSALEMGIWIDPADRVRLLEELRRSGRVSNFDARFRRADGAAIDVLLSCEQVELEGERCLVHVWRDVSEQKRRERALAESEERFAKAFLASPDMMTITRMDNGMLYAVNPGFERTTGYTAAEAVGRSVNDLGIWAIPGGREDFIARLRREGVVRELEFAIRTRNGTIVYGRLSAAQIELEGVPAVIGIVHDITAQKRVEQRLAESEERFEKAFHSSREAIGISRLADSQIVAVNHRFEHLYGLTAERIVGRTSLELGLWAGDPGLLERILTRLRTAGRIRDMMVEVSTAGGETRTCNYSADVIEIGGEPHVIGFLRDITEQRLAEARILELNASLVELNASLEQRVRERTGELQFANRELESFSYSISHDLRAPVRAIGGFASILATRHGATLNDDARRYLDLIDRNARRMGELIEDLLALARAARGALERNPVDMRRLVAGVIEDLGAGDRVAVAELPAVRGDASLLRQVWQNLIANSIKFSRHTAVPRIEVSGTALADGMVEYSVRDNGCGFDMRHAGKLFDVFQRLHSEQEYEGTGAGLAIVQRVVARHGGRVAAEGSPGRGARFSFVLPA